MSKNSGVVVSYLFSFLWGFGLIVLAFDLLDTIYRFIYTPLFMEDVLLPDGRIMELHPLMLINFIVLIICELIGINHIYHKRRVGAWWSSISVILIAVTSVWYFNSTPTANFIMWHAVYVGFILLFVVLPVIIFKSRYT